MSDWSSLFRSDEFRAYRKKQADMVANIIGAASRQVLSGGKVDISVLSGKLEMARMFFQLPPSLTQDEGLKELLAGQLAEDTAHIAQYLIRQSLAE